ADLLREMLPGFLADMGSEGDQDPTDRAGDDDLDRPATVRDLEAFSEKVMVEAMKVLRAAKPAPAKKPAPVKTDDGETPDPEPPPASPPLDLQSRLRKVFFG